MTKNWTITEEGEIRLKIQDEKCRFENLKNEELPMLGITLKK
jgi:hypothetical protein